MQNADLFARLAVLGNQKTAYPRGAYIVRSGEHPEYVYLITKGKIKLQKEQEAGQRDFLIPLSEKKLWGLKELILEKAFSYSIQSVSQTHCLVIRREQLLQEMQEDFQLKLSMMQAIAGDLAAFPAMSFE